MGYIKHMISKNRKCIVLDLDNTLWGGIVGEDGFDGISLGLYVLMASVLFRDLHVIKFP